MNYGQIKTQVKKLVNNYSKKGIQIPDKNNIDDLLRVPELLNDAQREIAEKERWQDAYPLLFSMEFETYKKYPLPESFKKAIKITSDAGDIYRITIQEECILLPTEIINPVLIYEKYPETVTETTEDAFEIEVKNANIIPYYIASFLSPDPDLQNRYMAEYTRKLSNITSIYSSKRRVLRAYEE